MKAQLVDLKSTARVILLTFKVPIEDFHKVNLQVQKIYNIGE